MKFIKGFMFIGEDHHPVPFRDDIQVDDFADAEELLGLVKEQSKDNPQGEVKGYLYTLVER